MTSVSGVTQNQGIALAADTSVGAASNGAIMDKDGFLKLFLASLQYQDPSSPMDTAEMMTQMSQLGNMEAVQNMTTAVSELKKIVSEMNGGLNKGAGYLGKHVVGVDSEGKVISGVVESVYTDTENVWLVVGGDKIHINQIAILSEPGAVKVPEGDSDKTESDIEKVEGDTGKVEADKEDKETETEKEKVS